MSDNIACPLCKLEPPEVHIEKTADYGERVTYNCPRCGVYTITGSAIEVAKHRELEPSLSAWVRNHSDSNRPLITSDTLKGIEENFPEYTPIEKQSNLLRKIEDRTKYPGHSVELIKRFDYPIAWAANEQEFLFYIEALIDRGLIKRSGVVPNHSTPIVNVCITAEGWTFLDEHKRLSVNSDQAFIAMSFSEGLKQVWEDGIKLAVAEAGYRPYRVDQEPHIDRIDSKIITEINNSRFLIADVTEQKQGVYYEAGYALGLGLPVIWTVRRDEIDNVHFDTRQYNHILWDSKAELKEQLYYMICAVIGKN